MSNWLYLKGGVAGLIARATKTEESAVDPGEFRGMTLLDMARELLERNGVNVRGMDKMRVASEAFVTRATQSTSDFAVLLENVMGKVLQAAYSIQPDTWTKFCAQSTVSDFRAHNRYRMSSFGALDALTQNGEFKNKTITDAEKNTITATTKGNIIAVSRQMIVNDDLGAFMRLLTMLGRAAALSVEVDVYALLAQNSGDGPTMGDGHALFDNTNHGNKPTGAALAAAALDLDRVAMANQKDVGGNDFIDLRPAVLLVPVGLGGQAKIINESLYDPDTVANKSQMKPNIVNGLFRMIVDTPRITGTRRYMFADPGIAPVLEVAFLEGATAPVMETKDGWRTDGAEMKVRFDYGVAAVDYRGAVSNAGV
jgi:phage major head subunit gpT-like protein